MAHKNPQDHKEYNHEWYLRNKAKTIEAGRRWKAENPERFRATRRDYDYRRHYGITLADYNAKLAAQGGRCAICQTDKPGGQGGFHVDHDHGNDKVRDLLCNRCNTSLGWFEKHRSAATAYLEKHDPQEPSVAA